MSISGEIDRIEQNVANTYAVLSALGADLPAEQNSDNLSTTAGTAKAVLYSPQSLSDDEKAQAKKNIDALDWKGEWSNSESYNKNDVVNYNGGSYIVAVDSVPSGVSPEDDPASWDVLAKIGGSVLEPSDDDLPKVFLNGEEFSNMTTEKNEVNMEMDYCSKTENFHSYIKIKFQGSTSLNFAKKNFTVKLFSDEARGTKQKHLFRDWKYEKNKFVLKANFIDHTHARNIVGANLWNEIVGKRSDYSTLPEELRNSPKNGAVDGFPVKVYVNGTYEGIYTWNIGKDDWMWGMDEDNTNHALLCATHNSNGVFKDRAYNFRAVWSGVDEDGFEVEVGTNSDALKNGLNAMLTFVFTNNGSTFKNGIGSYLDIQSAIDYYILQYVICGLDGLGKNILLGTYDLTKWYLGAYDMDAIFGLWYSGSKFVPTDYKCPEDYQEKFNLLFERLEENYWTEIQTRYAELRNSVLSVSNMFTHIERFMDKIGLDLYEEDLEIYPSIPLGDTNNVKQLRNYIRDRLAYCDEQIANGVVGTAVAFDSTALSLNLYTEETATLSTTLTPSTATDTVMWWSDNEAVATVSNGVVTPKSVGNCWIFAKYGSGYASCNVSVYSEAPASYTNQVPISIGTDGNVYNDGLGYKNGYRLSSSGGESASANACVTGFIPCKAGDTIRVKGYTWLNTSSSVNYIVVYNTSFSKVYTGNPKNGYDSATLIDSMTHDDTTGVSTIVLKSGLSFNYCRLSVYDSSIPDGANLIVTVNEEIPT